MLIEHITDNDDLWSSVDLIFNSRKIRLLSSYNDAFVFGDPATGALAFSRYKDCIVFSVAVSFDNEGCGISRVLIDYLIRYAKEYSAATIVADVVNTVKMPTLLRSLKFEKMSGDNNMFVYYVV